MVKRFIGCWIILPVLPENLSIELYDANELQMQYICDMIDLKKEGDFMAKTASTYIRLDPEVKADAEKIFAHYGMTLSQAVNIFIQQARNVGGLPFDLRPNAETIAAMEEAERIARDPNAKTYNSFSEIVDEVMQDEV